MSVRRIAPPVVPTVSSPPPEALPTPKPPPDAFGRERTPEASSAVPRLKASTKSQPPLLRMAAHKPLVSFELKFSSPPRTDLGPVNLPAVAGAPLSGVLQRFGGVETSIGDAATVTTQATFGTLSKAQFEAVHAALGGRSQVSFDPARVYRLDDFLPPQLQALVHQDLEIPAPIELKGTKKIGGDFSGIGENKSIGLTMNCHAAAWEAVRAYQAASPDRVAVFYGEMVTMDALTHDTPSFEKVGEVDAAHATKLSKLPLQPGDLIQFHEVSDWAKMTMLLHSAVYVGGGLFFEKPNTEGPEKADPAKASVQEETPFRLTTPENMIAPISQFVDGKFRIEVLRAKQPLEDPAKAFATSLEPELTAFAAKKGRPLGVELVIELEQGMGGNIKGEYASGLVRAGIAKSSDGTYALDPTLRN